MAYHCTILGNPRCLRIAQSWETLGGLSLHDPGKPQMPYDCTILGNPRWLIIAQSWETPDGLWLHNPLATYCHRDQSPCLDLLQRFKSGLDPKVMHDFAILSHPPILGGWANDKFFHKCIYEYIEKNCYPPGFCSFWGDIAHFVHLGGISTRFAFHNE